MHHSPRRIVTGKEGLLSIDLLAVPHLRPATALCRRRRSFEQPLSARSHSLHRATAININLSFHRSAIATFLRRVATLPPKVLLRNHCLVRRFSTTAPCLGDQADDADWNIVRSVRVKTLHISSPILAAKSPYFYEVSRGAYDLAISWYRSSNF
ncbi:hypothetical protein Ahy_A05g024321 [Arachis hypogaea]|uniref:Uncharacterized protein n=1 Tax=Arachis hypogaea TaxID=3818 RepID=A0A445D6A4_ARAHY|nr:hypothetical protein Ahy_A05g024321 [Arachis hypogaea]